MSVTEGGDTLSKQPKLFREDEEKELYVCSSYPLESANPLAFKVISLTDAWLNPVEVVGSVRRRKPLVRDIDIVGVGTVSNFKKAVENVVGLLDAKVKANGNQLARLLVNTTRGYVQVDLYRANPENYGILKLIRTGSAEHNVWLAKYAIKKGMRLLYSQGLIKDEKVIAGKDEKEVFEALGLKYVVPPEREIVNGKPVWLK